MSELVQSWAEAISTKDPRKMIELYAPDALLIPTFDQILKGRKKIYPYFVEFLDKKDMKCTIIKNEHLTLGDEFMTCSGYYKFEFIDEAGIDEMVLARYTYIFNKDGKIIVHHSSEQPVD